MKQGQVRIISGKWRGRKLHFPAVLGLRPTPDRVRETLFNWLAPVIVGANCLDLFAGSGALGLEALSRGAAHLTAIDQSAALVDYLRQLIVTLKIENMTIHRAPIPSADLPIPIKAKGPFDIVFLDPPFHQDLIAPCCEWLEQQKLLAPEALIYLETEATLNPLPIPSHWQLLHSKKAGQVSYHLASHVGSVATLLDPTYI